MKIAIAGTHCVGKTTLVETLSLAFPTYHAVEEPYYLLADEGRQFGAMPSLEDLEMQLDRSIECILHGTGDSLFERCPLDFLAYVFAHRDFREFDIAPWLAPVRSAVRQLDLIAFVPVEEPDRILVPDSENVELRRWVDERLRELLFEDPWGFEANALEVSGTPRERAHRVLSHLRCRPT